VGVSLMKTAKKKAGTKNKLPREELLSRISLDLTCASENHEIRGHRIWVSLMLDLIAGGMTKQELLKEYPQLEPADIDACNAYGAEMARECFVEIPLERKA
jgi:uncharacterized protein (DUF433 family)